MLFYHFFTEKSIIYSKSIKYNFHFKQFYSKIIVYYIFFTIIFVNSAIKLKRMYGIILLSKIILEWCLKKYTIKGDF